MSKRFHFFVMLTVLSALPFVSWASNVGDKLTSGGIVYEITSLDPMEVGLAGTAGATVLNVPSQITDSISNSWKVTSVVKGAFWNNSTVTSVTLPTSVTTVEAEAFRACSKLARIDLSMVTDIAEDALALCGNLETIKVNSANTMYYVGDDGVLYMSGKYQILVLYPAAKADTYFSVPSTCIRVLPYAFALCDHLQSVGIPPYVDIMEKAFMDNGSLKTFYVASGGIWASVDGVLCNSEKTKIVAYPSAKTSSYTIPSTITEIAPYAFYKAYQLKSVTIPSSVKTIGERAFSAAGLTSVSIPASVTTIGDYAFVDCRALTGITVNASNPNYSSVNGVLFNKSQTELLQCPILHGTGTTYSVPSTVKTIKTYAFYASTHTGLAVPDAVETIEWQACRSAAFETLSIAQGNNNMTIGNRAFAECESLKSLSLSNKIVTIGDGAFSGCTALASVSAASAYRLKEIGEEAFAQCTALTSFSINGGYTPLTTIGTRAFSGDVKLTSFTIPNSVTSIGESAFSDCSALTSVTFAETSKVSRIARNTFQHSGLTSISIPPSVTVIETEAFNSCQSLTEVQIPATATCVSPEAFLFCGKLENIFVDADNPNYADADGIFCNKQKTKLLTFPAAKANTFYTLLPPSLTEIGDSAFYYNKSLASISIPKKVTTIGEYAFALCEKLTRVNFLQNLPVFSNNFPVSAFYDKSKSSERGNIDIYVRNGKSSVYSALPFYQAFKSIKEATVQDGVEYFPLTTADYAIVNVNRDCYTLMASAYNWLDGGLKNVLIGDYAFEDSQTNIEEVVANTKVSYIGAAAFRKADSSLKPVKNTFFAFSADEPAVTATLRFGLQGLDVDYDEWGAGQHVYVKQSVVDDYKAEWTSYADLIDYKIPFTMSKTFGTFGREFPADFSSDNWDTERNCPKVIAFTANDADEEKIRPDGTYHLRLSSIYLGEGREKDGVLVPANTGVILKAVDGKTPENFYYRISEGNENYYSGSKVTTPVTLKAQDVAAAADGSIRFYVNGTGVTRFPGTVTMPVHTAYLTVPEVVAGAKLRLDFVTEADVTSVDAVSLAEGLGSAPDEWYTLQGVRVARPGKGVYIRNGHKVVLK